MLGDNGSFTDILRQAAQMKTASQATLRTIFDAYPPYLQHSLYMAEHFVALRNLPLTERLVKGKELKDKAKELYQEKKYEEAYNEYEKAVSLFVYVRNKNAQWKTQGVKDEDIHVVREEGSSQEEQENIRAFLLSCYLNISLCKFNNKDYKVSITACNSALEIDENNPKAYYRRAKALVTPASAGGLEQDAAIKDLKTAIQCKGEQDEIKKLLNTLLEEKRKQHMADKKTFDGMFKRGTIVEENDTEEERQRKRERAEAEKRKINEKELEDAKTLAKLYEQKGMIKEAEVIREKIAGVKQCYHKTTQKTVDFANPTPQMIQDAKEHGIDLNDMEIRDMFIQMQQEKEREREQKKGEEEKDMMNRIGRNGSPRISKLSDMKRNPNQVILNSMHRPKLLQLLRAEGIQCDDNDSDEKLRIIAEKVLECSAKRNEQVNARTWKIALCIAFVWVLYRFYTLGVFSLFFRTLLVWLRRENGEDYDMPNLNANGILNMGEHRFFSPNDEL